MIINPQRLHRLRKRQFRASKPHIVLVNSLIPGPSREYCEIFILLQTEVPDAEIAVRDESWVGCRDASISSMSHSLFFFISVLQIAVRSGRGACWCIRVSVSIRFPSRRKVSCQLLNKCSAEGGANGCRKSVDMGFHANGEISSPSVFHVLSSSSYLAMAYAAISPLTLSTAFV